MHNLKEGFEVVYSVHNNSFVNSKCTKCGEVIINGDIALIGNCFNTKHRGNETQYSKFFHRKCSETNKEWLKHDEELKASKLKERKINDILSKIDALKDDLTRVDG